MILPTVVGLDLSRAVDSAACNVPPPTQLVRVKRIPSRLLRRTDKVGRAGAGLVVPSRGWAATPVPFAAGYSSRAGVGAPVCFVIV